MEHTYGRATRPTSDNIIYPIRLLIKISFPQQQHLQERVSVLPYLSSSDGKVLNTTKFIVTLVTLTIY
jgi:hypothetical protein